MYIYTTCSSASRTCSHGDSERGGRVRVRSSLYRGGNPAQKVGGILHELAFRDPRTSRQGDGEGEAEQGREGGSGTSGPGTEGRSGQLGGWGAGALAWAGGSGGPSKTRLESLEGLFIIELRRHTHGMRPWEGARPSGGRLAPIHRGAFLGVCQPLAPAEASAGGSSQCEPPSEP
jgi:hypothetical protein